MLKKELIKQLGTAITLERLKQFELELGFNLQQDYKAYLMVMGDTKVHDCFIDDSVVIHYIMSICDIIAGIKVVQGLENEPCVVVSDRFFPIAYTSNQCIFYCLNKNKNDTKVYCLDFWGWPDEFLYPVAQSFKDFIVQLQLF